MESDRTNTSLEENSDGLPRMRPPNGRTSGPTRRSTRGQWTPEEDEILREAVQRFKGKNWKKIAECFKDRTDVQCLHRWQKVLDPALIKGPWTKEEDEIIIKKVNQYGAKKWSTIAQHLPGRIGKQCRERWHNHLNPAINKEAWTQEEELALIRAHQIYGNKWAELTKFLPGRSDNAIKNHWNSSVKKKLDSYLASGLLEQFQGLNHISHLNQSTPSKVQQSSADDSVREDGTEAEEISECSQSSSILACSRSTSDMANAVAYTAREHPCLAEEGNRGKGPSASPASCSENYYAPFQEVAFSMPEVPYEMGGSSMFPEHNFSHGWGSSAGKNWQLTSTELPNMSSLDSRQESSETSLQCIRGNQNHAVMASSLQTSLGMNDSTSIGSMAMASEKPEHMLIPHGEICRMTYQEAGSVGCFSDGNLPRCSNLIDMNECTDMLLFESSDFDIPEVDTLASQANDPARCDMFSRLCSHSFPLTSELPSNNSTLIFGVNPQELNDPSLRNEEVLKRTRDDFICTNDTTDSCNDEKENRGPEEQPDHANDSSKLVSVDDFCSGPSSYVPSVPPKDENSTIPSEQQDTGSLYYEPPRFPSLDIPFFSCDLIQSSSDMQQDFSPLGIRQLLMSSTGCLTPFRLWDSSSQDDSPDAVLKSAAKTFTGTPSILKKRHRDLLSPLSEKRNEKKLDCDTTPSGFSCLAMDFSRLEVMFDGGGNQQAPLLSPSANTLKAGVSTEDKENLNNSSRQRKEEGSERNEFAEKKNLEKEFDNSKPRGKIKQWTIGPDGKTRGDVDVASQIEPSTVLDERNTNDLHFFSPDQFGVKSDRSVSPSAGILRNQCPRRLEVASNQSVPSESSCKDPCIYLNSPTTGCGEKVVSHLGAVTSKQSTALTTLPDKNGTAVENLNIFGGTPFRRSIESPSGWKSPWFINTFIPGPVIDTDISIEDIGYFMSPGDRSYDAIGLMKQLSEHNAAAFADAQEVLGDETPDTILKGRCLNNLKANQEEDDQSAPESRSVLALNISTERRTLDFSECGTPGKRTENGRSAGALNCSSSLSPSSYLL